MGYLIFDKDGDLIDVLNFENTKELKKFKDRYPTYTVIDESEAKDEKGFIDDDFIEDEDDGDVW